MQSIMYDENSLVLATWYLKLSWQCTKLAKVWHNLSNFYFMPKTKISSAKFYYNCVANLQIYPCNKHQSRSKILINSSFAFLVVQKEWEKHIFALQRNLKCMQYTCFTSLVPTNALLLTCWRAHCTLWAPSCIGKP